MMYGPVVNCPARTWPEPTINPDGCTRCGMIHDADGRLLMGRCPTPGCVYVSLPGGAKHAGTCNVRLEDMHSTSVRTA